jgi:hypothetical protein
MLELKRPKKSPRQLSNLMRVSRNVTHLTAYNSFFQNLQSAGGGGGGGFRIPQKKKRASSYGRWVALEMQKEE